MKGVTDPAALIDVALALSADGKRDYEIARRLIPRSTIQKWRVDGRPGAGQLLGRHPRDLLRALRAAWDPMDAAQPPQHLGLASRQRRDP
jgi:hypothetical protein